MDAEKVRRLTENGIDYKVGVDRFAGNEELYVKFICRYSDEDHLNLLREAFANNDIEAALRAAHTLKGLVGNLSFSAYYKALSPVVELLHLGKIDEAKALMGEVEEAHTKVTEALKEV